MPRRVPGAVRSALGDTAVPKLPARTVGALTGPPSPHGSASPKVPPPWAGGAGGSAGACLDGGTEVLSRPGGAEPSRSRGAEPEARALPQSRLRPPELRFPGRQFTANGSFRCYK